MAHENPIRPQILGLNDGAKAASSKDPIDKKEEGKDRFLFKGTNGWWVGKDPNIDDGFHFNWSMSDGVPPQDWKYKWYLTYYDDPHLIAFGS